MMRSTKPIENNDQTESILKTVTVLSDAGSWLPSLIRQFREYREERRNPHARVTITAKPDAAALNKLVETRSPFASLAGQIRELIEEARHPHHIETSASPVVVEDIWSEHRAGLPRILSILLHVAIITLLLTPWVTSFKRPTLTETSIVFQQPDSTILTMPAPEQSGGGGGGGKHELTPPSFGRLPRAAAKQFVPPDPEPIKNLDPALVMEPTVVAPQLALVPQLGLLNIGDPNGVVGPPSSGPGGGGGIGTGNGRGIGAGNGPGVGPGNGGGYGGGAFQSGGNSGGVSRGGGAVTAPVLIRQVQPQYSEEARKARFEGTVLLETLVRKDGSVEVLEVVRSVGLGLDEEAIKAAEQWTFQPGKQNGQPVDVPLYIEVNFNIK